MIGDYIEKKVNRQIQDCLHGKIDQLIEEKIKSSCFLNAINSRIFERTIHLGINQRILAAEYAKLVENEINSKPIPKQPVKTNLKSKMVTQEDIESNWVRYWREKLQKDLPVELHAKCWELAYVPQALYERGALSGEKRGIGFGCGQEKLPSLFASMGNYITVTDQPCDGAYREAWEETKQYTSSLESVFFVDLIERKEFDKKVQLKYVDMNNIPTGNDWDEQYDFCWSICALEHLGSLQAGLDFIQNSLRLLKPGGTAVHTTAFNHTNMDIDFDNQLTVIFKEKHFLEFKEKLRKEGYVVADFDFNQGNNFFDHLWCTPPDDFHSPVGNPPYLKGWNMEFDCLVPWTCFGIIIQRPV